LAVAAVVYSSLWRAASTIRKTIRAVASPNASGCLFCVKTIQASIFLFMLFNILKKLRKVD